ncbi:hypothetical protein RhiirA4_482787 [Rhizophagus irregularis]|uniref:Uncharacterized protein n=1 Tax=Rhizophagus irregularis TaxID=588596 RepID=A0A2I1HLQ2_9GLOM|nr:hypothetical protein RhiirA4_482787 [Rhizophagus irregularis]
MGIILTSIKNFFEPTSKLKSSPIQISFVPFNINKSVCDCGNVYSETILLQKFCKNCLFVYIKNIKNFDAYLDIHYKKHLGIEEQFEILSEGLYFKQIITNHSLLFYDKLYETCELCGHKYYGIICSVCYLISFTWVDTTSTIPILYLPWWDTHNQCIVCDSELEFKSNCQKWCSNCLIIYTGCRYCLTTNIIFGITNQSQCRKCKRILSIDINISTDNMTNVGKYFLEFNNHNYNQISNYVNNIDQNSNLLEIYNFIKKLSYFNFRIYSQIKENNEDYLNELIIPIIFIPLNNNKSTCHYCKQIYSMTSLFNQKYCKNCLNWYIKYATSNVNIKTVINNLDVYIKTPNTNCNKYEPRNLRDLNFCNQEWCEN